MYTVPVRMSLAQRSLSLAGIIGILTAVFAGGLIYLLVTQPVSTAENIAQGEVSPIVKAVAGVLYDALRGILKVLEQDCVPLPASSFPLPASSSNAETTRLAPNSLPPTHSFLFRNLQSVIPSIHLNGVIPVL